MIEAKFWLITQRNALYSHEIKIKLSLNDTIVKTLILRLNYIQIIIVRLIESMKINPNYYENMQLLTKYGPKGYKEYKWVLFDVKFRLPTDK